MMTPEDERWYSLRCSCFILRFEFIFYQGKSVHFEWLSTKARTIVYMKNFLLLNLLLIICYYTWMFLPLYQRLHIYTYYRQQCSERPQTFKIIIKSLRVYITFITYGGLPLMLSRHKILSSANFIISRLFPECFFFTIFVI